MLAEKSVVIMPIVAITPGMIAINVLFHGSGN